MIKNKFKIFALDGPWGSSSGNNNPGSGGGFSGGNNNNKDSIDDLLNDLTQKYNFINHDLNDLFKEIEIFFNNNLIKIEKQLDDFTFELKLKNLEENTGGGYSRGTKRIPILSSDQQGMKSSAARTVMPVIKDVNVRRERKKKPSITTIPIDLGTKVVGGGQNQQPMTGSSGGKANRTPSGSPVNNSNPYMQIVPEILGIYV